MVTSAVKEFNVLITGVGGQGVILMSELLGDAATRSGINVRGSEVLGMAVRGGSVFSNIRLGSEVHAPLTPISKADILVSMEPSEALRNITYLSDKSTVIINTIKTIPFTVFLGKSAYPSLEEILDKISKITKKIITLDAARLADEAGSHLSANIVMLGALFGTGQMPVSEDIIMEAVRKRFPPKAAATNIRAFELGYKAAKEALG